MRSNLKEFVSSIESQYLQRGEMSLTRSVSPPEASQLGSRSQAAESPVSTAAGAAAVGSTDDRVLFEGYLFKVPPLRKSLLMAVSTVFIPMLQLQQKCRLRNFIVFYCFFLEMVETLFCIKESNSSKLYSLDKYSSSQQLIQCLFIHFTCGQYLASITGY